MQKPRNNPAGRCASNSRPGQDNIVFELYKVNSLERAKSMYFYIYIRKVGGKEKVSIWFIRRFKRKACTYTYMYKIRVLKGKVLRNRSPIRKRVVVTLDIRRNPVNSAFFENCRIMRGRRGRIKQNRREFSNRDVERESREQGKGENRRGEDGPGGKGGSERRRRGRRPTISEARLCVNVWLAFGRQP